MNQLSLVLDEFTDSAARHDAWRTNVQTQIPSKTVYSVGRLKVHMAGIDALDYL